MKSISISPNHYSKKLTNSSLFLLCPVSVIVMNMNSKVMIDTLTESMLQKLESHAVDQDIQTTKTKTDVDQALFRQGMSNLGAAVNIITTQGAGGQAGFTASAVCSVTDSPPTLLVCLNRSASVFETFKSNKVLCVNTLASHQQYLSNLFGGKTPMSERFAQGEWQTLKTLAPVLQDALVSFDCEVVQSMSVGSHDVLICEVKAIQHNQEQNALLYFNRSYCEPQPMN